MTRATARLGSQRILRCACLVLLLVAVAGCSTAAKIRELDHQRLLVTRDALIIERDQLTLEPDPTVGHQAEVFIGETGLNKALASGSQFKFTLSKVKDVEFTVTQAQVDFRNAIAELRLDIRARHVKYGFEVELKSLTELNVTESSTNPSSGEIQFHVVRMVPIAKWGFFQIRFGLFVQRLLRIAASDYTAHMPAVTFPVQNELPYKLQGEDIDIEIGDAVAHGPLTTPALSGTFKATIDRWYILSDGLHVYLNLSI